MPVLSSIKLNHVEQSTLKNLVWKVLTQAVKTKTLVLPPAPVSTTEPGTDLPSISKSTSNALSQLAASFVTLYVGGQLRGCIGTTNARNPLWLDVCMHSYSSAFEDWRFEPLTKDELNDISFDISILSEMVSIENTGEQALLEQLAVGIDGLLIKKDNLSALFLPSVWQKLTTPELFLQALKQKIGWQERYWSPKIQLFRFHTFVCHSDNYSD